MLFVSTPQIASFSLATLFFVGSINVCSADTIPQATGAKARNARANNVKASATIRVEASDISNFDAALNTLSRLGKVDCVIESTPLIHRLSAEKVAEVLKKSKDFDTLADGVADAYDYRLDRSGAVLRFLKRYSDPNDLPEVTLEEATASLQATLFAISSLVPAPVRREDRQDSFLFALSSVLSDQEKADMASGNGISVASLSPEKKQAVKNIALHVKYKVPLTFLPQALLWIREVKRQNVPFTNSSEADLQGIGFDFKLANKIQKRLPVSNLDGGLIRSVNGLVQSDLSEGALKSFQLQYVKGKTEQPKFQPPNSMTLREAALLLSKEARPTGPIGQGLDFQVDEMISSHSVILVRRGFSTPLELLKSIAFVYGLDVNSTKQGAQTTHAVARPRPRPVKTPADVGTAVRRYLPASLLRALEGAGQSLQEKIDKEARKSDPLFVESMPMPNRTRRAAKDMKNAAVFHLLLNLQKQIASSPEKSVSFAQLDENSKGIVGLMLLLSTVPRIYDSFLVEPVPEFITNFDGMAIGGGIKEGADGTQTFSVDIGKRMGNGKLLPLVGMGPGRYIP